MLTYTPLDGLENQESKYLFLELHQFDDKIAFDIQIFRYLYHRHSLLDHNAIKYV